MFCSTRGTALETTDDFCRSRGAPNSSSLPPPLSSPPPPMPPPPRDQFGANDRSPSFAYARTSPRTNTLAIVSLVAGFVFWPARIICGFIARPQIRVTPKAGDGMALAGIIISIAAVFLMALFIILFITLFSHVLSCGGQPIPIGQNPGVGPWTCVHGLWNS